VAVSLYALLWVVRPQPAQPYRTSFLAVTLAMTLLAYWPLTGGRAASKEERAQGGDNPGPLDWALAAVAVVSLVYPLLVFDDFARRVVRPTGLDVILGVVATLLVLEATRRTVGWVLPAICLAFVAYAFFGGFLPFGWDLGHKGYDLERLVGQTYMGIEGIFGVPLDVAATYIVLFTITSVEDLRGKRVSVGSPGSGTEVIALRVLEAAGLDPDDDIQRQQLGVGESVQAVKDGALDAFFWSGGVPTSAVTDLATSRELLLLPTDQYVAALKERYGDFYVSAEIEPGRYEGMEAPVKVVAVPNYLVVNRSMDPELAYQLTRLLFDQKQALAEVHPSAGRLELETAPEVAPLELHPGARRYYYDEQAST
jgi:hypothetical protein